MAPRTVLHIRAHPWRARRFRWLPFRRNAWEVEIVGHGWTQAMTVGQVAYMARDWMSCTYATDPDNYHVEIEWL